MEKTMIQQLKDTFTDNDLITFDGYDQAILGYHHDSDRVVYSMEKLVQIIYNEHSIWDEKFTLSDAFDQVAYNFKNSFCGPKTPMIIYDIKE